MFSRILLKTLKLIQKEGSDALYKGEIGKALVKEVQKRDGSMTMDDLKNYVVKEREPVKTTYRGYDVVSAAPPSSGGLTVQQILKLMEGYDVEKNGFQYASVFAAFNGSDALSFSRTARRIWQMKTFTKCRKKDC